MLTIFPLALDPSMERPDFHFVRSTICGKKGLLRSVGATIHRKFANPQQIPVRSAVADASVPRRVRNTEAKVVVVNLLGASTSNSRLICSSNHA